MSDAAEKLAAVDIERKIPGYFAPLYLARQFREVAVDFMEIDKQLVRTRWFQSDHDVDLLVWLDDRGNIIKQQLTLCGQVVEWNLLDGLRTGMLIQEEVGDSSPCSESIVYDTKGPDRMSVQQALDLLQATTCIETDVHVSLIRNLTSPRALRDWPQEEVLSKFGRGNRRPLSSTTLRQRLARLAAKLKSWLPQRD